MIAKLLIAWDNAVLQFRNLLKRLTGTSMRIPVLSGTGLIDRTRVRLFNLVTIERKLYANMEVDGVFFTCVATADMLELLNNSFQDVGITKVEFGQISETVPSETFIEPAPKLQQVQV